MGDFFKTTFFGEFFGRPIWEMPTIHAGALDAYFYFHRDTVRINRLRPEYHASKQLLKGCHSEAVLLCTTNPLCTAPNLYWRIQSDQQRVTTRTYPVTLRHIHHSPHIHQQVKTSRKQVWVVLCRVIHPRKSAVLPLLILAPTLILVGYGLQDVKRMELEKMGQGDLMCAPSRNASIMTRFHHECENFETCHAFDMDHLFVPDSPLFHEWTSAKNVAMKNKIE